MNDMTPPLAAPDPETFNPSPDRPLRVAIFVTNPPGVYGGGRLAAFILAQCLASVGADVAFVTNARPVFYDDLKHFGHPGQVGLFVTRDFHTGLPDGAFDIVVIIPGQSQDRLFYIGARGFARRRGARPVLFNFETPNWFNASSPEARSEDMWLEWRRCTEDGCLVLSNSQQSMHFAQSYYTDFPDSTRFDYWHQPINVQALARVEPQYRENRVVCFIRARDPHKGGQDIIDVLSEDLRGWTLCLIVGSATLDEDYRDAIFAAAEPFGINIEIRPLLSDNDKFVELKRARMLLYPSRFEGYGLPPIEALSAGTPCVCYDLPVFREVCGDALVAAPVADVDALRDGIRRVVDSAAGDWDHLQQAVASVASIQACGVTALRSLNDFLRTPALPLSLGTRGDEKSPAPNAANIMRGGWKYLREPGSAVIQGWVATSTPLIRLEAFVGTRPLWVQSGVARPDVMKRLNTFPVQDPGISIHLGQDDLAALDAAGKGGVLLRIVTADGVVADTLQPKWVGSAPGAPLLPPPLPDRPDLPPIGEITRASCDEYGVVEFDGWALARPGIEVIRFWSGDQLLGETVPNRVNTGIHNRHRAYGDAFAGLHLAARLPEVCLAEVPWRAEFLRGDDMVFARGGHTTPLRRAQATLGADVALLPTGFLTDRTRPPVVALVVTDAGLLQPLAGAARRALLAHLRRAGHEILLILHGNPHRFADDLPRWQALADAIILANPLTPHPGDTAPRAAWDLSSSALEAVLAGLTGYPGRLRLVLGDGIGLAPALGILRAQGGLARAILVEATPPDAALDMARQDDTRLLRFGAGDDALTIGFDAPGLAAEVSPIADPALDKGPVVAIDATGPAVDAALLRPILAAARSFVRLKRARLAVVIDAPPLAAGAQLRARLGLPPECLLLWPQAVAAAAPGRIATLIIPGRHPTEGPVTALAIARGIPLLVWKPETARPGLLSAFRATAKGLVPCDSPAESGQHPYAAFDDFLKDAAGP
ncbi:glycosyltransferase [Humitalea sp. 24SJ18S-53]|uniref:glycosyltransferase n=1 Tax=Humitalea sp. 24SJ18S-53 TaxID=3422307 RepID=UPI003D67095D